MLLLALQWGGTTYPWKSATIIGLFCGFLATLFVFVAWEYRCGDEAMMPLGLLKRRIVYSSCIVSIGQMGGVQLSAYYLPLWFQVIRGASPTMSGVYFMGSVGPQIVFALLSGALGMQHSASPFFVARFPFSILTISSFKTRILPPMGYWRKSSLNNRFRTTEYPKSILKRRPIHRLSNFNRHRSRSRATAIINSCSD